MDGHVFCLASSVFKKLDILHVNLNLQKERESKERGEWEEGSDNTAYIPENNNCYAFCKGIQAQSTLPESPSLPFNNTKYTSLIYFICLKSECLNLWLLV